MESASKAREQDDDEQPQKLSAIRTETASDHSDRGPPQSLFHHRESNDLPASRYQHGYLTSQQSLFVSGECNEEQLNDLLGSRNEKDQLRNERDQLEDERDQLEERQRAERQERKAERTHYIRSMMATVWVPRALSPSPNSPLSACDEEELAVASTKGERRRSLDAEWDNFSSSSEQYEEDRLMKRSEIVASYDQQQAVDPLLTQERRARKDIQYTVRKRLAPFLPYVDKSQSPQPSSGYLVDRHWIDLDLTIKSWLNQCDTTHHGHCTKAEGEHDGFDNKSPIWLIDVVSWCLVRATPDKRYFALSYVWGQAKGSCATSANLESLQQRNAFKQDELDIPKLIIDVMKLIDLLGERYLWCDRYCIVQDRTTEKMLQLDAMAHIYKNSYATIVASSRKSTAEGLYGIRDVTRPRRKGKISLGGPYTPNRSSARRYWDATDSWAVPVHTDTSEGDSSNDEHEEASSVRRSPGRAMSPKNISDEPVERTAKESKLSESHCFLKVHSRGTRTNTPESEEGVKEAAERLNTEDGTPLVAKLTEPTTAQPQAEEAEVDYFVRLASLLMNSDWGSRAWTFQESLFARRKIVFQDEMVNWECHCISCYEGQATFGSDDTSTCLSPWSPMSSGNTWPDAYRFARLISLYNQRDLTFPEDAHNAFLGTLSDLCQTFSGGFVSGLPVMFFDAALIWQPYEPAIRRRNTGNRPDSEHIHIPSWSWIGWKGDIDSKSLRSSYDYMRRNPDEFLTEEGDEWEPTSWHTESTVKWSYKLRRDCESNEISPSGHRFRDVTSLNEEDATKPPEGWKAHKDQDRKRDYYTHVSRYEARVLVSYTSSCALLKVGRTSRNFEVSHCLYVKLLDKYDHSVGFLRVNRPASLEYEYGPSVREIEEYPDEGSEIEVIELSAGSVKRQKTEEVSFDEWPVSNRDSREHGTLYEFYNVMMVKRHEWYATRVAVGRVEKAVWERVSRERTSIVLG
ncbi:HET-domain-containing protein [Lophium mytilinum]|uniref:HET-domain-containing protein n=1 Tax=Lophium mytilinum TaxID=390894 RepID=A0A6A6R5M2_9PEZI|nr:HET-domain-containing protein [Lophium mytilinum]